MLFSLLVLRFKLLCNNWLLLIELHFYFFIFCLLQYGPIVDIDLKIPPRPPGYAFVEVSSDIGTSMKLAQECVNKFVPSSLGLCHMGFRYNPDHKNDQASN